MLNIHFLIQELDKTILESRIGTELLSDPDDISLLKNQSELTSRSLYIGSYSTGLKLLEHSSPDVPVTMFLSVDDVNVTKLPTCGPHNLVVSTLDIPDIYNRLNAVLNKYQRWNRMLLEIGCINPGIPQILSAAAQFPRTQIYVLNPAYKVIAKSGPVYFDNPVSLELEEHGFFPFETALTLNEISTGSSHFYSATIKSVTCHLCQVPYSPQQSATLLIPENPHTEPLDYGYLLSRLSDIISNALRSSQETPANQDLLFRTFLDDIFEERLDTSAEIQNRLQLLAQPLEDFCCFVLIRFDTEAHNQAAHLNFSLPPTRQKESLYSYTLQQLKTIFPQANIGLYRNDIVILHSQKERPLDKMDFDYDRLADLLEGCGAYAGISNASRHRARLRTMYMIASRTLELGRCLHRPGLPERIFTYEDYSMSYIIDLCAQEFIDVHHHNDLIYLIHPSIIKICRYDAAHKTNLRDVLYYYLLCGCNVSRTAKTMYMHRNTVLNKLNKINEIAEIPLEDGYTQQRMIMSCLVMQYYEKYLNMTIRL